MQASGQPKIAREACLSLAEFARQDQRAYPIFIAPYISPAAAEICEEYKAGYLDFAGNCRLAFDSVFIQKEGFPNPTAATRDLRSLYSPKAECVLRALLASGPRTWRTQVLADAAQVSLGQVASVKKLLADREWIETGPAGFGLAGYSLGSLDGRGNGSGQGYGFGPGSGAGSGDGSGFADGTSGPIKVAVLPLLMEWARAYRPERSSTSEFYSLKPIPEIEANLAEAAKSQKNQVAFTAFSGAARLAPAVRYQRATAYVAGDVDAIAEKLALKRVNSGANVALIEPYDEGVFFGTRNLDGAPVVSPIQIYLDLMQIKGRGDEAATAILEEVIKPLWR
ncbi:MAG: type IV toxin-antitoxin system AbiEi family antitoxin [Bryobacteraceae bacterium]